MEGFTGNGFISLAVEETGTEKIILAFFCEIWLSRINFVPVEPKGSLKCVLMQKKITLHK